MARDPAPRVVIAANNAAGQTGAVRIIHSHAQLLAAQGWAVTVVAAQADTAALRRAGVTVQRFRPSIWPWARHRQAFRRSAETWIASQRFDVVVGHGDLIAQDILNLHNCVHLASELIHQRPLPADDELGQHHAAMLGGKRFRILVANGELMKRDVVTRFAIDPDRVVVIHPGYDPARFRRADRERLGGPIRASLPIPRDRLLMGFITSGRFDKRGLDLLIAAIASLDQTVRDRLHLLVVGSEGDPARYERMASEAGFAGRITLLPKQSAIESYYHALDLFVLPARLEEFGMAAQEAMVCGVPSIVSDRMGVSERLRGGSDAGIVAAGEVPSLAAALARFIREPQIRSAWADFAVERCRANTWDANWAEHAPLYQRVLDERRSPS